MKFLLVLLFVSTLGLTALEVKQNKDKCAKVCAKSPKSGSCLATCAKTLEKKPQVKSQVKPQIQKKAVRVNIGNGAFLEPMISAFFVAIVAFLVI